MRKEKESNFVSIVAYMRDNEKEIEVFLDKVHKIMDVNFSKFEIIFVDDASTDGSVQKIKEHAKTMDCVVNIIKMSYFQGIEKSLNAGVDLAIGDYIYEFESVCIDYEPELIMDTYNKMTEGNDIVFVSPSKTSFSKKLFYSIYNMSVSKYTKICSNRFRLLSRRAINRVASINGKIPYRKAAFAESGLKSAIIKYKPINIIANHHKEDSSNINKTAFESIIIFTDAITKVSAFFCALFLLLGIFSLVHLIVSGAIRELMTNICLGSFGFGVVTLILTFIIHYMSIVVYSQFKKQEYVIENIEKVNKNQ